MLQLLATYTYLEPSLSPPLEAMLVSGK